MSMDKQRIVDILMNLSFVSGDKPHAQMTLTRLGCEQIADALALDKTEKPFPVSECCRTGAEKFWDEPERQWYHRCTNCHQECKLAEWSKPKVEVELPKPIEIMYVCDYGDTDKLLKDIWRVKETLNRVIDYLRAKGGGGRSIMTFSHFIYIFNKIACFVGYLTLICFTLVSCLLTAMALLRKYYDWRYGKGSGNDI